MTKALRGLTALLFICTLSSCFVGRMATNEPYAHDAITGLVPGKSTARDVVEKLGAPNDVVRLTKGSAYLYEHSLQKVGGLVMIVVNLVNVDRRSDRIWAFFDENDKLTHIGATLSSESASYALPWNNLYDKKIGEKEGAGEGK